MLWNQTAIGFISEEQDVQVSFDGGPHVGVDASGDTTVVLFVMQQPLENSTQRIVKLDPDGNVRWAKRVSDAGGLVSWGGARTLTFADGSAIVTHSSMLPPDGTYRWIIDEIDSDGAPIRRHLQNANKGWDLGPVMDRARLFQTMGHPDNYFAFQAIDLDANTCDVFVIPVRQCPEETGFHGCPPVSIAVSEGTLYFSVGTRVGAVTLP